MTRRLAGGPWPWARLPDAVRGWLVTDGPRPQRTPSMVHALRRRPDTPRHYPLMPMRGRRVLVSLCANLHIANEPAGNQRASRTDGPADQGHACRADGELKVSAAL